MKNIFLIFLCLVLIGCGDPKKSIFFDKAIKFRDTFKNNDVWAEVIHYQYKNIKTNKKYYHAMVVYKYPPNSPYLRTYDKRGSFAIADFYGEERMNYPFEIAQQAELKRNNVNNEITKAEFVK